MGIAALPKAKWRIAGKQPGIKEDMIDLEEGLLESFGLAGQPAIEWIDATSIKVPATTQDVASMMLIGYPSQLHPGRFVHGGLTNSTYRVNSADVTMDFDLADSRWGLEKPSQWYVVYGIAGDTDPGFVLKAMPYMRVQGQASKVISLGTLVNPASGIGYGFVANELVGGMLYFFSGASRGLIREITANNDDSGTGGTITYGGAAVTLAQGDWFVVLPPATNFRWMLDVFNDASSNIEQIYQHGKLIQFINTFSCGVAGGVTEAIQLCSPIATTIGIEAVGTGFVGHPAGTAPHYGLIQCDTNDGNNFFVIPVKNCRFFGANVSIYRQYYTY